VAISFHNDARRFIKAFVRTTRRKIKSFRRSSPQQISWLCTEETKHKYTKQVAACSTDSKRTRRCCHLPNKVENISKYSLQSYSVTGRVRGFPSFPSRKIAPFIWEIRACTPAPSTWFFGPGPVRTPNDIRPVGRK